MHIDNRNVDVEKDYDPVKVQDKWHILTMIMLKHSVSPGSIRNNALNPLISDPDA